MGDNVSEISTGVQGSVFSRAAVTAHDSQSVGEEVDVPSSDTETVGSVSDVSFDASSSSVVLEQEPVVDEGVVGLAVREALRAPCIRDEIPTQVSERRIPFCDAGGTARGCHGS